jgi:O-antigen/teichoic acid export membrane protein
MTIRRRLAAFATLGAGGWGINFLTLAALARTLGQDAFGLLTFGLSLASLATTLAGPGLNLWGVRAVARDPRRAAQYVVLVNGTQFVLGLFAYAALTAIAFSYFAPPERNIALLCGLMLFTTAGGIQWLCQGLERYDLIGALQFLTAALTYSGVVALVHGPEDVVRVPIVMAGAQLASAIGIGFIASRRGLGAWSIRADEILPVLRQAIPLGVSTIFVLVLHHANTVILQFYRGASEVGVFSTGFRLVELITVAPTVVASVFLPRLSRLHSRDAGQTEGEMRRFVQVAMGAAFLPAAILLAESTEVTRGLYGPEFVSAPQVVQLMSVAVLFNFASITYLMGTIAMGQDRAFVTSIAVGLVVSVGGGFLTVPSAGFWGAAIVFASIDCAIWLALLPAYRRSFGTVFLREWLRPVVAAAIFLAWSATASALGVGFGPRLSIAVLLYLLIVAPRYIRLIRNVSVPVN